MVNKTYHVEYGFDDTWKIRTSGASRASGTFVKQADAIKNARIKALKAGTELYIHGEDGRIRDREIYTSAAPGASGAIIVQEEPVKYVHRTKRACKVGRDLVVPVENVRIRKITDAVGRKKPR
jgi:hypothetical protein